MRRWGALGILLAVAAALALRLPHLDARPLHNDESVNAVKLAALLDKGSYTYDPHEFHGPSLHYFSLAAVRLLGCRDSAQLNETNLRLAPVLFGVGLIVLLLLVKDGLGTTATLCGAVLTAVSPAMVFYSRYFIHEMPLVFFTLLTIAAGWRYTRTRRPAWAATAGAGLGLMYATKETFVFAAAAIVLAAVATVTWTNWRAQLSTLRAGTSGTNPDSLCGLSNLAKSLNRNHLALALAVAAGVSLLLFSSFFTNPSGPLDSMRSYLAWLSRAQGQGLHANPWSFYFERLLWFHARRGPIWSEAFIFVLAMAGAAVALFGSRPAIRPWVRSDVAGRSADSPACGIREPVACDLKPADMAVRAPSALPCFFTFYTAILTVIYMVIPYKTPWCLLGFWSGTILLAGFGASALLQLCRRESTKWITIIALLLGVAHLGYQAWRASFPFASDRRNPYVYAQTLPQVLELVERVKALARVEPRGNEMVVKVLCPESYWPLPWYLRGFPNAGWWDQLPDDPYAPVIIVSANLGAALDEKSNKSWLMTGLYELRPGVFLELYVEKELWKRLVEPGAGTQQRESPANAP